MGRAQSVDGRWLGLRRGHNLGRGDTVHLIFAVACAAVISLGIVGATLYGHGIAADFGALWRASRGNPYAPDAFAPFAYPPTALIWIKPLALLPFWPAFVMWSVTSLAAYFSVTRRSLLLMAPAVVQCLAFGQTSLLIAALILAPVRPQWRGAMLGVAMTLKPQLLFLAPLVFLVRRDWQTLGMMAVAATASALVSIILFGVQPWLDWIHALPHFAKVVADRDLWWVTITPYGTAMRFGLNPWPFWIAGTGLALSIAVRSRADPIFVSVLASLIASPYAVGHDIVALLPFVSIRRPFGALLFSGAFPPLALIGMALSHDHGEADGAPKNIPRRDLLLGAGLSGVGRRRRRAL